MKFLIKLQFIQLFLYPKFFQQFFSDMQYPFTQPLKPFFHSKTVLSSLRGESQSEKKLLCKQITQNTHTSMRSTRKTRDTTVSARFSAKMPRESNPLLVDFIAPQIFNLPEKENLFLNKINLSRACQMCSLCRFVNDGR